jgi:AraC-like DNA-binding protein
LTDIGDGVPVFTGEGNIVVAGGITGSNFYPKSTAYMLCMGEKSEAQASGTGWLPWIVLTAMVLLAALLYVLLCRKRTEDNPAETPDCCDESEKHLFQRISTLMDNEKSYLRSDLKLSDVSALLSTNSRYVSEAIRNQCGSSFTQFVNGYRVEHAKRLMRENPDRKITEIAVLSGFSGESSFFRTFKTFTGLTPKEWIAQNG